METNMFSLLLELRFYHLFALVACVIAVPLSYSFWFYAWFVCSCIYIYRTYYGSRVSVILGLLFGDEGKGKVVKHLSECPVDEDEFNLGTRIIDYILAQKTKICVRFNGANNAGHTLHVRQEDGTTKKVITHLVPSGYVNGWISIICRTVLVDPEALKAEVEMLRKMGIINKIYVSKDATLILPEHVEADRANNETFRNRSDAKETGELNSTGSGVRYAMKSKVMREGTKAGAKPELFEQIPDCELIDVHNFLYRKHQLSSIGLEIVAEGAQGYGLDPDTENYPYVTSGNCSLAPIFGSEICPTWINLKRDIWGIAKFPVSYVGSMNYMREDCPDLEAFRNYPGCEECGSTTGRKRQIDYLDLEQLFRAIKDNSVNNLVVNKCDIVENIFNGVYPQNSAENCPFEQKAYPDIASLIVPKRLVKELIAYENGITTNKKTHKTPDKTTDETTEKLVQEMIQKTPLLSNLEANEDVSNEISNETSKCKKGNKNINFEDYPYLEYGAICYSLAKIREHEDPDKYIVSFVWLSCYYDFLKSTIYTNCPSVNNIIFSKSPEEL